MGKVKVLIADDFPMTVKFLVKLINCSDFAEVVDVAQNGREVIHLAREHKPDIILMDLNLPFIDGMTALEEILNFSVKTKVIMHSCYEDVWIIKKCINTGASGYISKGSDSDIILDGIKMVANCGVYLDEKVLDLLSNEQDLNQKNITKDQHYYKYSDLSVV